MLEGCNLYLLTRKKILVTGASSGIGKECAIFCANTGADVILVGRNSEKLQDTLKTIEKFGGNYQCIEADLTNTEDLNNIISQIDSLNGLVLSAGQVSVSPISFTDVNKIEELYNINFKPIAFLTQQLLKKKKLKSGSSVVAISSALGNIGFMPGNASYGVSKASVEAWMKYCALEYAKKNIRFNTILPGGIETPMANLENLTEDQKKADIAQVPMGRYGQPREIATAAAFLLSDAASYITGASLIIDGGRHLKY